MVGTTGRCLPVEALRQLGNGRALSNPKGLEQLQTAMLEPLKNFELALHHSVGLGADGRPAAGVRAAAPAEYRALVEEYYRVLAGSTRRTSSVPHTHQAHRLRGATR